MVDKEKWSDVLNLISKDNEKYNLALVDNLILQINYPEDFNETMTVFRVAVMNQEISERVLDLTKSVINYNPSDYTAWAWRKKCLVELKKDLNEEIEFLTEKMKNFKKNYQMWNHRRKIISEMEHLNTEKEFEFMDSLIDDDTKNIHAWTYRFWFVNFTKRFEREFDFANMCIKNDPGNNSAWNHRYNIHSVAKDKNKENILSEIEFVVYFIKRNDDNESLWNYLRGLFRLYSNAINEDSEFRLALAEKLEGLFQDKNKSKAEEKLLFFNKFLVNSYYANDFDVWDKEKLKKLCETYCKDLFLRSAERYAAFEFE